MNKKQEILFSLLIKIPMIFSGLFFPTGLYLILCHENGWDHSPIWIMIVLFLGNILSLLMILCSDVIRKNIENKLKKEDI